MGASLQFEASPNIQLMLTLLGAIVVILVGFGLWQLARRKWRDGIVCLAGALGPLAVIPVLAVSAVQPETVPLSAGRGAGVFVGLITGEWLLRRSWQLH